MALEDNSTSVSSPLAAVLRTRFLVPVATLAVGLLSVRYGSLPAWWLVPLLAPSLLFSLVNSAPRTGSDGDRTGAQLPIPGLTAAELARAVPDPLLIFDAGGDIVHANAAAIREFGPIRTGTPVQLRFRAPEMQALFRDVFSSQAGQISIDYSEKVPLERLYRVTASRIEHTPPLFVMGFRDHSEIRRIDRMRADFIANASHELRTPLASVAGFIETLRGPAKNDAAARERFLKIMQGQTERMARLIDDLLSLSRLEMKPQAGPGEPIDIRELLDGVIVTLRHLADDLGVVVEKTYPDRPVIVTASRDELIQVFQNLLENACKYGQSGGRVLIGVSEDEQEASVAVRDFGPGIEAEHIPRITERFYRVDVNPDRAQKGTGLGLSIVKHILTRHDARLSIRSVVGQGSEFKVHFPRR